MTRYGTTMLALAALATTGVLAACGGSGSTDEEPAAEPAPEAAGSGTALLGTVGPGFTISLVDGSGQPVTALTAGTYTITVDDQAAAHDFHLSGPGVDEATDVAGTGQTTWTVDLQPGEYTFVCDPHASSMNGSFTVS